MGRCCTEWPIKTRWLTVGSRVVVVVRGANPCLAPAVVALPAELRGGGGGDAGPAQLLAAATSAASA